MDSFAEVAGPQDALIRQPDAMRHGLQSLHCPLDNNAVHSVESIQKNHMKNSLRLQEQMLSLNYGSHFVDGLRKERSCLAGVRRAGGLPSSMIALEASLGTLHNISYEDYMNLPMHRTEMKDIHQQLEERFADDY